MAKKAGGRTNKSKMMLIAMVIVFIVGGVCGYFVTNYITRNDKFEILGEKNIVLVLGEEYGEEEGTAGAVVISFGRDISDKVVAESNIDYEAVGDYYIRYSVDDIRFRGVYRYRYIEIVESLEVEP